MRRGQRFHLREITQLLMPRPVGALVQQTLEGPAEHLSEILHPAQEDVTADRIVLLLDQMADEPGQRALADAALTADETDADTAPRAGANHAAHPLYFRVPSDEELDRRRLSGPEGTRLGVHEAPNRRRAPVVRVTSLRDRLFGRIHTGGGQRGCPSTIGSAALIISRVERRVPYSPPP